MKHARLIIFTCLLWVFSWGQAAAQENVLTIYIPENDYYARQSLELGIQLMKKSHPDVTIQADYLPGYWYDGEYAKRLSAELMAGSGPDVIVLTERTFPDIHKAARSNLFADLSGFFQEDQDFNRSQYITPALDSGMIGQQQIFVPILLRVPFLISTEEILSSYSLANLQPTSTDLLSILELLGNADAPQYFSEKSAVLYALPSASGIPWIDYDHMSSNLDSEAIRKFFELSAIIYARDYEKTEGSIYWTDLDQFNDLDSKRFIFGLEEYSLDHVFLTSSLLKGASHTPVSFALPTIEGGVHAYTASALAVNANSQNKEAAYEFIKTMLSKEVQYPESIYGPSIVFIPVRNAEWKNAVMNLAKTFSQSTIDVNGAELSFDEIPSSLVDYFSELPNKITECGFINYQLLEMCFDSLYPYYEGVKTLDEALGELQFKLELYAGE